MAITNGFFFQLPLNPASLIPSLANEALPGSVQNSLAALNQIPLIVGDIMGSPSTLNFDYNNLDRLSGLIGSPSTANFNFNTLGGIPGALGIPGVSTFFGGDSPSTYYARYPMPYPDFVPSTANMQLPPPNSSRAGSNNSSLQKFITEVKNRDFAFQSKYKVTLPTAVGIQNTSLANSVMPAETMQLYCESAELPGMAFQTLPYHFMGPDFHRPSDVSYGQSIRLVFLMDQEFGIRKYFDNWVKLINDPISFTFRYPASYMTSGIIVKQLKHRGEDLGGKDIGVFAMRLIDAFPQSVDTMTVMAGSREIHRLIVSITYSRWIAAYGDIDPDIDFSHSSNNAETPSTQLDPYRTGQTLDQDYGTFGPVYEGTGE